MAEDQIESAGDFYGFVLQRYRRSLNALIGALTLLTLGVVAVGVWLVFAVDKVETGAEFQQQRLETMEHDLHEAGHAVDNVEDVIAALPSPLPTDFPTPSGELRKRLTCVDQNVRELRQGLRALLVQGISIDEFFANFQFRTCP
jgi:hypothetical protein